jgi:hypothetical protein
MQSSLSRHLTLPTNTGLGYLGLYEDKHSSLFFSDATEEEDRKVL